MIGDDVDRVLWRNPVEFYGRSDRLDLGDVAEASAPVATSSGATFEGNSVLRGAREA